MEFFKTLWNDLYGIFGDRIELGTNSVTTLNIIIWSLFIGFLIAIGVTLYNKLIIGKLVRALISREANSEQSALSTAEVGCDNIFIRFALRKNGSLRRIARMVGDTDAERADVGFEAAKFYISVECTRRAQSIYGKQDASTGSVILSILAFLALAIVSFIVIPDLVQLLANFIGTIAPKDNIL